MRERRRDVPTPAPDVDLDVRVGAPPGDAAFAYVPATVAPEEVVVVLVDRSGPLTTGVVLLTGGRTVEFSGVESRPFAVTESVVPAVVAFAEK